MIELGQVRSVDGSSAIVGFVAAIAQEIGLPPIGGYYVLNLLYPLWLLPFVGAVRLAHPKSYYPYWFYNRNPAKYCRAVQRFGLQAEYAELVARQIGELTDDQKTYQPHAKANRRRSIAALPPPRS